MSLQAIYVYGKFAVYALVASHIPQICLIRIWLITGYALHVLTICRYGSIAQKILVIEKYEGTHRKVSSSPICW